MAPYTRMICLLVLACAAASVYGDIEADEVTMDVGGRKVLSFKWKPKVIVGTTAALSKSACKAKGYYWYPTGCSTVQIAGAGKNYGVAFGKAVGYTGGTKAVNVGKAKAKGLDAFASTIGGATVAPGHATSGGVAVAKAKNLHKIKHNPHW